MAVRYFQGRRLAGLAAASFMLVVAGCQGGDTLGAMRLPGTGGGNAAQQSAAAERITVQELLAYCPQVSVRESEAFFDAYSRNGQDDPSKLIFRATIGETTRACRYNDGVLGMTIAMAGRVIPGPAGTAGNVRVPIRILIMRDEEVLYSQTRDFDVAVGDTAGATQFVFTDEAISVPMPATQNYRVYVGYNKEARR